MRRRLTFALLAIVVLAAHAAADELTSAKSADIKRLMELTGSTNLAQQFASASSQQMFEMLKRARPDIPERALAVMNDTLTGLFSEKLAAPGGLLDQVAPIYHRHFSHQEIKDLLAFYQTPLGKKTIQVLPSIAQESMIAGQQWGRSLAPEIESRIGAALRREGLIP